MKRFFSIISLILITIIAHPQNPMKNYELGYYFDINSQNINGYFDIDYEPEEMLKVSYTVGEDFTPGYYYTNSSEKISGTLKYSSKNTYFTFKNNRNFEIKTIKPEECNGYVIGKDSFAVIQNFLVQREIGGFECNKKEFAEVIEKFDSITFYKHIKTGMNGIVTTYLYSYGNSNNYTSFSKDQLKFIESTKSIFSDFLVLEQKIASGKYREREIPILAKLLKYKRKFDKSEKILFNSSWDEVDNPNESEYYANINSIKDSVFHLSYFFKDGTPVYEGHYTSFYPHLKNGEFIWYYPNGVIRKKATYINNTPQSINTFYKNGQIHHYYKLYKKEIKLAQVYSENGDSLLNSQGNGFESFFDSIGKREITNEFVNRELAKSYYFDSNKRKISLFCDKFAKIKNLRNFQTNIDEINTYPINSVQKFNHGIALVKFIIEKEIGRAHV